MPTPASIRRSSEPAPADLSPLGAIRDFLRALAAAVADPARPFDPDRLDARDPALIAAVLPFARLFNRRYVHLRVDGLQHLAPGPALFVANHNGGIAGPDLVCTLATLWEHRDPDAPLYMLAHDFAMRQVPRFGAAVQRFGAVRAAPDNAARALRAGAGVLVYPGGDLDAYRHTRRRDEVVFGPRTGFVRVAQTTGAPIVPIVAHGAHRSAYIFTEGEALARWLGLKRWGRLERFPLALALPWLLAPGPWLPYLPLPFSIRLRILPPIAAPPDADPAHLRDHVRAAMQAALDDLARTSR